MASRRSAWWAIACFIAGALFGGGAPALGQPPEASPVASGAPLARPPLIVGIAIDEVGISQGDLKRASDLALSLLDILPDGALVSVASFSREPRIVCAPTKDKAVLSKALATFKPSNTGVALPDGLFDVVDFVSGVTADARALLLVSAGRVREGDLHFEDPLNAASTRDMPIVTLGLGQGDGKLLRRIARITRGEYVHIEVADAATLARALVPRTETAARGAEAKPPEAVAAEPTPAPITSAPARLLGAAAVLFGVGLLLILGTIVILVRRANASRVPVNDPGAPASVIASSHMNPRRTAAAPLTISSDEIDSGLEKTMVVNVDPVLRALSGPGAGKNFPLSTSGQTSIGRSRRNDIVVPEDGASAQHCRIDREGDSYVLHDLGATNGTWVNGTRTERAVLQHGDRLKVGDTVFTVSLFGDRS
jgi:hypothetical protein